MKCSICSEVPQFICLCNYSTFCQDHLGPHMNDQTDHKPEKLYVTLDDLKHEKLKIVASLRLQDINKSKNEVYLLANTLIQKIENAYKKALDELNNLSRFYSTLLSLDKSSKSLELEAQKILATTMILKVSTPDISLSLEEGFNRNLVTYVKKTQEDELRRREYQSSYINRISNKQEKEIRSKELESKKNQAINRNKKLKNDVRETNSWSLLDKTEYMESLKIEVYQDAFSYTGTYKFPIFEIKFSDDTKFCFICKIYSGSFK